MTTIQHTRVKPGDVRVGDRLVYLDDALQQQASPVTFVAAVRQGGRADGRTVGYRIQTEADPDGALWPARGTVEIMREATPVTEPEPLQAAPVPDSWATASRQAFEDRHAAIVRALRDMADEVEKIKPEPVSVGAGSALLGRRKPGDPEPERVVDYTRAAVRVQEAVAWGVANAKVSALTYAAQDAEKAARESAR